MSFAQVHDRSQIKSLMSKTLGYYIGCTSLNGLGGWRVNPLFCSKAFLRWGRRIGCLWIEATSFMRARGVNYIAPIWGYEYFLGALDSFQAFSNNGILLHLNGDSFSACVVHELNLIVESRLILITLRKLKIPYSLRKTLTCQGMLYFSPLNIQFHLA